MKKINLILILLLSALLCFSACEKAENENEETEIEETEGENSETEKEDEKGPKTYEIKFESDFIRETAELTLSPDGTFELTGGYNVHEEKDDLELFKDATFETLDYFVKSKYSGSWTEKDGVYTLTSSENLYTYLYDPLIRDDMISYLDALGTQSPGYYAPGEYEAFVNMEYIAKEDAGTRDYKMVVELQFEGDKPVVLSVKELDKQDDTVLKVTTFESGEPVTFSSYFRSNQRVSETIYLENGKRHHKESYSSDTGELLNTYYFDEYGEIIEE